ncbi:11781_t:CDS:2 [Diversispora eburnea]|uniref:11781_t:CDS:1 n=1 Tax=Diversispora eburnea TaxID=1213867 RepID=A0A9N8ZR31_9GLOM|nr:11781_t:CDS:2 [Diversispora eburnea]
MIRINRLNIIKSQFCTHNILFNIRNEKFNNNTNIIFRPFNNKRRISTYPDKINKEKNPHIFQRRYLNQDTNAAGVWDPFPDPFQPIVEKSAESALDEDNDRKKKPSDDKKKKREGATWLSPRVMDAVLTTVMGLAAVGIGVELAFLRPLPLLRSKTKSNFFAKEERKKIDSIVSGRGAGKYYLLMGERGTGKTQLVLNAMEKVKHYGIVFAEAHSDSEVFKTRLGKALKYTFREDYVGQLFAREAPERGSALLDVEKALNMIEIVAVKYKKRRGRPIVLIINNIHAFKDDEDGEDLLELLQQRAESWAAAKIVNVVFNTDDYTVYERMKRDASRMDVIRIGELADQEALQLLQEKRRRRYGPESEEKLKQILKDRVGGRLSYINRLGRERDLDKTVETLEAEEKHWLTNRIGLIPDFEETAFDDQKYASCAWKLIRKLVKSEERSLPLKECRTITGNPKWIEMMDHDNIIMIDDQHNVKADSKILLNIFEKIVNDEEFDELLENVCERVEEVDKEQRTRELIWSKKNDQVVRVAKPKRWLW